MRERVSNRQPFDRKPLIFQLGHEAVDNFSGSKGLFVGAGYVQAIQTIVNLQKQKEEEDEKTVLVPCVNYNPDIGRGMIGDSRPQSGLYIYFSYSLRVFLISV